jgi:hypothetical protein
MKTKFPAGRREFFEDVMQSRGGSRLRDGNDAC